MKNKNNFQGGEGQLQGSICLIFCEFLPGVAYKSVAYKKSVQILLLHLRDTRIIPS